MIRVVIADDDAGFVEAMVSWLAGEPDIEVVGQAKDGVEAITQVLDRTPDLLVTDLEMPVMGGVEAIEHLKREAPGVAVLVLSGYDDDGHLFAAFRAGADSYLTRGPGALDRIAEAIRRVYAGERIIPGSIVPLMQANFRKIEELERRQHRLRRLYSLLSAKEVGVLELIGQRLTNASIAERLCVEESTVKSHVRSILKKLQVNSKLAAAELARECGL